jgi:hypothetical protein
MIASEQLVGNKKMASFLLLHRNDGHWGLRPPNKAAWGLLDIS